jgi:parvulin-like peptidyl-prolyl isomerase
MIFLPQQLQKEREKEKEQERIQKEKQNKQRQSNLSHQSNLTNQSDQTYYRYYQERRSNQSETPHRYRSFRARYQIHRHRKNETAGEIFAKVFAIVGGLCLLAGIVILVIGITQKQLYAYILGPILITIGILACIVMGVLLCKASESEINRTRVSPSMTSQTIPNYANGTTETPTNNQHVIPQVYQ